MHNIFCLIGLNQPQDLHKLFVEQEKDTQKGVFVLIIEMIGLPLSPRLISVKKCSLEDFNVESESNEDQIMNNAIAQSIRQYDTSYQYCAMFEIDETIVGGAFIPFDQPIELELAIDQAIATYRNL